MTIDNGHLLAQGLEHAGHSKLASQCIAIRTNMARQ